MSSGQYTSLMHGWVPLIVQAAAALAWLLALGLPTRRGPLRLSLIAALGAATVAGAYWYVADDMSSGEPPPTTLWVWIALGGSAVGLLGLGWRAAPWWRRTAAVLAVPLCMLSAGLVLNAWIGYFPTVRTAWDQLTSGPLPNQSDLETVRAMAAAGTPPATGRVLPVSIPADASHFKHRGELVYLPPAWFAQSPPPALPAVVMIGGEFNTPADWLRSGGAIQAVDEFAAAHGGNAPVLVFVDAGGSFNNDTECVNGPRGNVADHLTKDVVPFMISNFGVSAQPQQWGVAGWSMGGTCAVDLTVMHPDLFTAFVDISGDLSPNSGNRAQTIARLFGGNLDAWAAFDPSTVITRHGHYDGISGLFAVNGSAAAPDPGGQLAAADSLCALGRANGIDCAVVSEPGRHDWPFAAHAFAAALPWLAGQLDTPGVPAVPLVEPTAEAADWHASGTPTDVATGR